MKKLLFTFMLLGVAMITFGQVVTDTIPVVHTTGESIGTFLKNNGWNLALIIFLLASEWLGTTGVVKEGSVYAWLVNMVGKIIRSKTDLVKTKKAKFMTEAQLKAVKGIKILVIGLFLAGMGLTASSQGKWTITKEDFQMSSKEARVQNKELYSFATNKDSIVYVKNRVFIRTAANAAIVNLTYNKDLKKWDSDFLSLIGYGATVQWYTLENDKVIETWGVTGLVMTNTGAFVDETGTKLYLGVIGSYRGLLTLGTNIDLRTGKLGIMPGVQLTF